MAGPPGGDRYEVELAAAVMEYLTRHPQAMDTVAGIAEWWLPETEIRGDLRVMRRVLDRLAEQSLLERIGAGANPHYRLKKV
jgi:hypothetical protein